MKKTIKYFLIITLILSLTTLVYAEANNPDNDLRAKNITEASFLDKSVTDYLKNEYYNLATLRASKFPIIQLFIPKAFAAAGNVDEDKNKIREEWKEFLGLDIFYPYFKAKEIQNYIQEKSAVRLFNMRGKAEFNKTSKEIKYIFKKIF